MAKINNKYDVNSHVNSIKRIYILVVSLFLTMTFCWSNLDSKIKQQRISEILESVFAVYNLTKIEGGIEGLPLLERADLLKLETSKGVGLYTALLLKDEARDAQDIIKEAFSNDREFASA